MARDSSGHRALRAWFRARPHVVKSHEAEAMSMTRQQLDHLLAGRRRPTLDQAISIYKHTGIEPYRWN